MGSTHELCSLPAQHLLLWYERQKKTKKKQIKHKIKDILTHFKSKSLQQISPHNGSIKCTTVCVIYSMNSVPLFAVETFSTLPAADFSWGKRQTEKRKLIRGQTALTCSFFFFHHPPPPNKNITISDAYSLIRPKYTVMTSMVAMTTGGGWMTTSYCVF